MHMANELLSLPVAAGTLATAAGALGWVCRRVQQALTAERLALTGMLGAFVFAAQMVNIQLPGMPGTSCHLVGTVLLAIILGPHAAALAISSVVMIQCLIFQDGGLLALGCNIINMALVPAYLGTWIFRRFTGSQATSQRFYLATLVACLLTIEAGALLVPVETALSGVLVVPFKVFAGTLLGVHALIGLVEGLLTVTVLAYLQQVRPDLLSLPITGHIRLSRRTVLITLALGTVLLGAGLSLLASGLPDGLEWTYAQRPDQPQFKPMIAPPTAQTVAVNQFQDKLALMPNYSPHQAKPNPSGWTSLAGLLGSLLTMGLIWAMAKLLSRRHHRLAAT